MFAKLTPGQEVQTVVAAGYGGWSFAVSYTQKTQPTNARVVIGGVGG